MDITRSFRFSLLTTPLLDWHFISGSLRGMLGGSKGRKELSYNGWEIYLKLKHIVSSPTNFSSLLAKLIAFIGSLLIIMVGRGMGVGC